MKRTFFVLTLVLIYSFTISCTQVQNQNRNQSQNRRQQLIAGVESSISEEGDIQRIKVTADNADIRTGCSPTTPVVQPTNRNETYDVVSKVQDWFAVKLPNNQIGFIPQGQCKPIVAEDNRPEITPSNTGGSTPAPAGTGTRAPSNAGTAPQAGGPPKTPTTTANSTSLTSMEQQMITLVNQARSQNNLPALKIDMQVTNVARVKAQDMIDNNYFSHNSPKYGSPFDMMKSFGVDFVKAGENIAGNQTVQAAHNALMNSPGHRENLLSPDYTHIGIGIKQGGQYGNMFTQMFVSKPK